MIAKIVASGGGSQVESLSCKIREPFIPETATKGIMILSG
jgi:hypothetical protein